MDRLEEKGFKENGGIVTMPFIIANEVGEELAFVGFGANMISYLTGQLNMPITKAANALSIFSTTASLTPLLGAFIADSFAGRFWTIALASVINQLGMIILTLSAILPKLRPPPCIDDEVCKEASSCQLAILYISLLLIAIGSGGIRACAVSFGADQFDESDPKQKTSTWKLFSWYCFCLEASMLVAGTIFVYFQDYVSWGWRLGIPTTAMAFSMMTFISGYPFYRKLDPAGSPFTRLMQVCVAAYKKRKLPMVSDPKLLFENQHLDASISLGGSFIHTNHIKFLDKAAIVAEGDDIEAPNFWNLNTVHRVEELKSFIRMGPIWVAVILIEISYSQLDIFSGQQEKTMDRHLTKSFQIPEVSMEVFKLLSLLMIRNLTRSLNPWLTRQGSQSNYLSSARRRSGLLFMNDPAGDANTKGPLRNTCGLN